MACTKQDIRDWFLRGVSDGKTHMIIVCDTYDHEDYPVYCSSIEDAHKQYDDHNGVNMQTVMEVYNLSQDMESQLNEHRARNW